MQLASLVAVVSNLLGSQKLEEAIARLEAGASGEGEKTAITFLGKLRSRAEKCWRSWLDEQIVWVNQSHGVPLNGKRAGVMQSFSKYPSFLYRILSTNSGVTPGSIATSLTSLADALFESLDMVTTRSSCDKQVRKLCVYAFERSNFRRFRHFLRFRRF